MPNCTRLTRRTVAFESVVLILLVAAEPPSLCTKAATLEFYFYTICWVFIVPQTQIVWGNGSSLFVKMQWRSNLEATHFRSAPRASLPPLSLSFALFTHARDASELGDFLTLLENADAWRPEFGRTGAGNVRRINCMGISDALVRDSDNPLARRRE